MAHREPWVANESIDVHTEALPVVELAAPVSEPAEFAAAELRRYFELMLQPSDGETSGAAPLIIRLGVDPELYPNGEAHGWHAEPGRVVIGAGGGLGLVFAVYAFLRDVCGCVFAAPGPDGEFVPRGRRIDLHIKPTRREPALWYRSVQFYFFEPPEHYQHLIDWMAKNGFNYVLFHLGTELDSKTLREQVDPKTGHALFPEALGPSAYDEDYFSRHLLPHIRRRGLKLDFNHHNLWYWVPPKLHAAPHPEWFAQVNGQRGAMLSQMCLCTSNPDAVAEIVRRVRAFLAAHPEVEIVGVVPEDGHGMCQCEGCVALDGNRDDAFVEHRDYRSPAGENRSLARRYARLLNTVGRAIRDEFPNVLVGGMAYVDLVFPPRDEPLEPNIVMQVAVYWRDGARALAADGTSAVNRFYFDQIRAWRRALPGRLLLYEYYMGMMAQKSLPYPMASVIAEDWSALIAAGVEGASVQCIAGTAQSYVLNLTAFARCAWGEPVDVSRLIADYARGLFGDAAGELAWIFERWQDAADALRPLDELSRDPDPLHREERVLLPDGRNIAYFWRALGSEQAVAESLSNARRSAGSPRATRNVERFAAYLEYCRLAAAAMSDRIAADRLRGTDPAEADRREDHAIRVSCPAVIHYAEANPLPGWILPRSIVRWKSELAAMVRQREDRLSAASLAAAQG